MASVAELRQILKEDSSGKNLYDHLTETLMKILLDRPGNAYDNFELISSDIKSNPLNPDPEAGKAVPASAEEISKQLEWSKKSSALLKIPEEAPEESAVKFPDLLSERDLLEWAGVSLGKGNVYRLYLSIKTLAESPIGDAEKLRFFGRISTRTKPYYIVQGINPEEEEGVEETKQEGKSGANKYAFWVSQNIEAGASSWVKLPNVTMTQVVIARQFKRFLTGDLNAPVPSYPPFPGTERNLLRAQIARILGATSVSPDGFFDLDEESDPPTIKEAEAEAMAERFPKTSTDLKDPEGWKHHEVDLNVLGRVNAMPEQTDENGEPIEPEEPIEVTPPLDPIKTDQWTFRVCPGGSGVAASSAVVARSLVWPGAVAVAAGSKFVNVYIGNGVVYENKPYSPPLPAPIQSEWAPSEEDGDALQLVEQADVREDPTPPVPEGEGDEED